MTDTGTKKLATTSHQILGPFYPVHATPSKGGDLTRVDGRPGHADGQVIYLGGRVLDRDGNPVRQGKIEIWQANTHGRYTHPNDTNAAPARPPILRGSPLSTLMMMATTALKQ